MEVSKFPITKSSSSFEIQKHQKCFHLKCVVYECEKFRKLTTLRRRKGKCFRNSYIDLTKSSELKKLTESHSENEIEKESPVREAKMLLYWVTTTTIFVLYYKYFSFPMYSRYFKHHHFSQFSTYILNIIRRSVRSTLHFSPKNLRMSKWS